LGSAQWAQVLDLLQVQVQVQGLWASDWQHVHHVDEQKDQKARTSEGN
jgi:hypothetical protein